MDNDKFWEIVRKFNVLMDSAIMGPNCLEVCNGDCCSIKIDVPKILAEEYIKQGYATKDDFIRSDIFSFKLRFDENKGKCFLFDKSIKGCSVHNSGIKPPQCWIYPTNFSNPQNKMLNCKKANGWKIIQPQKLEQAEKLLQYYIFLCKLEAKKELNLIKNRIDNALAKNLLIDLLKSISPRELAGFKDTWDRIVPLSAQGISLQMKKFCEKYNNECDINYFECRSICDKLIRVLLEFLQQNVFKYVKINGLDQEGEYSFLKLDKFIII